MKNLLIALAALLSLHAYSQTADEFYSSIKKEIDVIKALNPSDGNDKEVWDILTALNQETMQGDDGGVTQQTASKLNTMFNDTKLKNIQLLMLFAMYQTNVTADDYNANLQSALLKLMLEESKAIYGEVPCLILIYECETLMSNGKNAEAEKQLRVALQQYPESIPLQVYLHKLVTDATEKKLLHDKLIKEHPNHWTVKQFLGE